MFKKILILVLLLVFVGAGVGGMSSFAWLTGHQKSETNAPPKVETVMVLSAGKDISAGDLLKPDDLVGKSMNQEDFAGKGSLADDSANRSGVVGAMIRRSLHAGDFLKNADVLRTGDRGFLSLALSPGMRAVTIGVDSVTGTPGLIWPGDYVDLILTQGANGGSSGMPAAHHAISSEIVLSNIRVIAIDKHLVHGDDTSKELTAQQYGHTATLEVSPEDAERVYVASGLGRISLVVRAARDGDNSIKTDPITAQDVSRMAASQGKASDSRTVKMYSGESEKEVSY